MALTDVEIYESHPDVKALNDEYVALGKNMPNLANAVSEAGNKLAEAEAARQNAIREATAAVQAANKALAKTKAEQDLLVVSATRAYNETLEAQKHATQRRATVQRMHNEAMNAINAVNAESEDEPQE